MTIPDSLRNLYDPSAPYLYPEVGSSKMWGGGSGEYPKSNLYEKVPDYTRPYREKPGIESAQDFWSQQYEAVEKEARELEQARELKEKELRLQQLREVQCDDDSALFKWKFHRQAFIDYGNQSDLDEMLKFVREGQNKYDDIALEDWEPKPGHQSSWWLAAWWHRRCAGARAFWKDHFGTARRKRLETG